MVVSISRIALSFELQVQSPTVGLNNLGATLASSLHNQQPALRPVRHADLAYYGSKGSVGHPSCQPTRAVIPVELCLQPSNAERAQTSCTARQAVSFAHRNVCRPPAATYPAWQDRPKWVLGLHFGVMAASLSGKGELCTSAGLTCRMLA